MSANEYFERQIRLRGIRREWCEWVVANAIATEKQDDDRTRHWAFVAEAEHYIRVVTEPDGSLLNAFFDRTFERKRGR